MIFKAIEGFNWNKACLDINADERNSIITETIFNILSNFILNEIVTIDNRDPLGLIIKPIFN